MFREERVGVVGTLGEKTQEGKVFTAFILLLLLLLLVLVLLLVLLLLLCLCFRLSLRLRFRLSFLMASGWTRCFESG